MPTNTYNTEVNYYRINANNTNIATSTDGLGSPTEEIAPPLSAGGSGFLNKAGNVINGNGTNFNLFSPGQYLFFINSSGIYVLLGQIDTITDADTLEITSGSYPGQLPSLGNTLAASYSLVTTSEAIYIRVGVEKGGVNLSQTQANIPLLTSWRLSNTPQASNNQNVTKLEQYSNVGTPSSIGATVQPVPFTLEVMTRFIANSNTTAAASWNSVDEIPDYIWLKAVVKGGTTSLNGQTMYRFTTEETIDALVVSPGFSNITLNASGYFNVTTGTGIGGSTGGNQ